MSDPAAISSSRPLADTRPGRLPTPLSSFIGREGEVGGILALLRRAQVRLVTLTGPGGVGKTRLAVHAATLAAADLPNGVWFVDLAPLTDPALVMPTIARTLGLQESGGDPVDAQLAGFLRERRALLVLDNVEQVVAAAPEVAQLLAACPGVTVLATSREPMAVAGEQQYPVLPLGIGVASDAVRLFSDRARASVPDFAVTGEIEPVLVGICDRLDGLPLAIELAAARIKALPPAELLARLDRRIPLLTGTRRDLPRRQQTMRNAIAWSYDLLSTGEQALFRHLAVFVGGFTIDAAEAVLGHRDVDVLDGVASLVDKSLLGQRVSVSGAVRYAMLETVREYGLEQLEVSGEMEAQLGRHAAWVADFAVRTVDLLGPVSVQALARLADEHDNARSALRWTITTGAAELGLRIATAFYRVWQIRGYLGEGRQWLADVLALGGPAPAGLRSAAMFSHGWLAYLQGDLAAAESAFRQALPLAERAAVGHVESLALTGLGVCAASQGDLDLAGNWHRQALEIARAHGDDLGVGGALLNLGTVAADRGDLKEAARCHEEALPLLRRAGEPWVLAILLGNIGALARDQGDFRSAASADRERLAINLALANREQQADCCQTAAGVALRLGQAERAAHLAGVAARVREEIGFAGDPLYRQGNVSTEAAIRDALGACAFLQEWAAGRAMSLEDAVVHADRVLAEEEAAPVPSSPPTLPAGLAMDHPLTPREVEVLRLIAKDWSNQQIADALFLSRRTVHKHVENILGKLGVDSRAGAAVWAVRHGID